MGLRVIATSTGEHHPELADLLCRASTVDVLDAAPAAPALLSDRVESAYAARATVDEWRGEGLVAHAWLVDERVQWDGASGCPGDPVPGYKQVSFLRRLPAISPEAFADAWTHHAELARVHHPTLLRYTQNIVVEPLLPDTPDVDGIAELTMRLRQDFVDRMYDSDAGRRTIGADVRGFIDLRAGWRLRTREFRRGDPSS